MMKTIIIVGYFVACYILLVVEIKSVVGLSCIKCQKSLCKDVGPCKGGMGKDVCGCCDACLKVPGEECGGPWNIHGRCDKHLFCKKEIPPNRIGFNIVGKCEPCPPLCKRHFPYGNVLDKNGCPICKGKKPRLLKESCGRISGLCKKGLKCIHSRCESCPPLCKKYFPYGNAFDKNGCPLCEGKKPRLLNESCGRISGLCKKGLKCVYSRCAFPHCPSYRRHSFHSQYCPRKRTVFCTKSCKCCTHRNSCNPSWFYYKKPYDCCELSFTKH